MRRARRLRTVAILTGLVAMAPLGGCVSAQPPSTAPVVDSSLRDGDVPGVIVLGVPGLTWDQIDRGGLPALAALAERSGIGSVSVRGATTTVTCPSDSWATLGAGSRAVGLAPTTDAHRCPPDVEAGAVHPNPDGSADFPGQRDAVARNDRLHIPARPGALADAVGCVAVVGAAAAPAGAHSTGRIDQYMPEVPDDLPPALARCPVTIVAAPAAGPAADQLAARLEAARPARTELIVTGIGDLGGEARLHAILANGPGFGRGWLTSTSTQRRGYVQLMDIAATAIDVRKVPTPLSVLGRPMAIDTRSTTEPGGPVLADADRRARAQQSLTTRYFTVLVVIELLLYLAAARALRRRWRAVDEGPAPRARRHGVERALEIGAFGSVALVPAALVAQLVPWWRAASPGVALAASVVVFATALTAAVYAGPWRRTVLGRIGASAALCGLIPLADILTGSRLQVDAVVGYSTVAAGRFFGLGNVAFAQVVAGGLIALGCVVQRLPARRRLPAVLVIGTVLVVVIGVRPWGNFVGGLVALTAAVAVMAVRLTPRRLSSTTMLGLVVLISLVIAGFAGFDYARPPFQRTGLGRFIATLYDGHVLQTLRTEAFRKVALMVTSPLTLVVVGGAILLAIVLLRPEGGLRRVFGIYPAVRAAMAGVVVAAGLGFGLSESGVAVPAFAALVALPLSLAFCLRLGVAVRPHDATRFASPAEGGQQ